jgi:hypothetical protein
MKLKSKYKNAANKVGLCPACQNPDAILIAPIKNVNFKIRRMNRNHHVFPKNKSAAQLSSWNGANIGITV